MVSPLFTSTYKTFAHLHYNMSSPSFTNNEEMPDCLSETVELLQDIGLSPVEQNIHEAELDANLTDGILQQVQSTHNDQNSVSCPATPEFAEPLIPSYFVPGSADAVANNAVTDNTAPEELCSSNQAEQQTAVVDEVLEDTGTSKRRREEMLDVKPYDASSYGVALSCAWHEAPKKRFFQPIWETNRFLAPIFGQCNIPQVELKSTYVSHSGLDTEPVIPFAGGQIWNGHTFAKALRAFKNIPWPVSEESNRAKALLRWKRILELEPHSMEVGRQILATLSMGGTEDDQSNVIADVFSNKSTKTLLSRSGSLSLYFEFCSRIDKKPFPLSEPVCYAYLSHLKQTGAPPTRASCFMSALAFCNVLGLDGVSTVLSSARCTGSAFNQQLIKKPLAQRRPLTVSEIMKLERIVLQSTDKYDRLFAGFCLFLVFARARNSDTFHVYEMVPDFVRRTEGFIQINVKGTKTSTTVSKKTRFLPLVAHRRGFLDEPWADAWLAVRAELGLNCQGEFDPCPLMPMPLLNGKLSDRPISASEVRKWLIELLMPSDSMSDVSKIGSHSCKASVLSMMSKIGASPDIRRYLGYHTQSDDKSLLTYSRDAASGPLWALSKMLSAVRAKLFDPDVTKSGYMSGELALVGFDKWFPGMTLEDVSNTAFDQGNHSIPTLPLGLSVRNSDDSDSSSSSESSEADVVEARNLKSHAASSSSASLASDGACVFHQVFTTVHKLRETGGGRMVCGRVVRPGYKELNGSLMSGDWPRCKMCFPP